MFGRTLKSSIAADNGRSVEFIRRRNYPDKSHCYECGEEGHLSYACPTNALGEREAPPKKERKRKKKDNQGCEFPLYDSDDDDDDWRTTKKEQQDANPEEEPDLETLSAAIRMEQEQAERLNKAEPSGSFVTSKRKRIKKNAYFSDEEDLSE